MSFMTRRPSSFVEFVFSPYQRSLDGTRVYRNTKAFPDDCGHIFPRQITSLLLDEVEDLVCALNPNANLRVC
jgi:hypothetical protein